MASDYKWDGARYYSKSMANQKAKIWRSSGFKAKVVTVKKKYITEYKVMYGNKK
jgi:hypothetical protein